MYRLKRNLEIVDPEASVISDFLSFIVKTKKFDKDSFRELEDIIKEHKDKL